ncbi:hypothetical protein HMPREF1221_01515 [Treponema socranskii subsp. paredis ATCC 35535]|nr:hypothetical protein HMPREF1221_01515 [Treponema socranskii subsp. paredis ATCC 35535]
MLYSMICLTKKYGLIAICAISFALASCSRFMGYGMLLWDIPERDLRDGDILPVYIRSNISHTYAVSAPDSKDRFDIPLWQITTPASRRETKKIKLRYAEFLHRYASVKLDGLPIRAEPVNTARQVYRLRKGEIIKILYKGEGQAVMTGSDALEGNWLRVLTSSGTQGWCFSYNLELFEMQKGGEAAPGARSGEEEKDDAFEKLAGTIWYPDYYRSMIREKRIDPIRMNAAYCFTVDAENQKVSLNLPERYGSWEYGAATKTADGEYTFTDTPVKVSVRDNYIAVTCADDAGRPRDYNFIALGDDVDIAALVAEEKERRGTEYVRIAAAGPNFKSAAYGQLSLKRDGSFTWRGNRRLVPSLIAESAKGGGTVGIDYFIDELLSPQYDGVLSFSFEGMKAKVNFLYKIEANGIRLEDAAEARFEGNTLVRRGASPLVIFFEKN